MPEIDWARVIDDDGGRTPRDVLLEFLDDCDSFDVLIVVANKRDAEGNDEWAYGSSGSAVKCAAIAAATTPAELEAIAWEI